MSLTCVIKYIADEIVIQANKVYIIYDCNEKKKKES